MVLIKIKRRDEIVFTNSYIIVLSDNNSNEDPDEKFENPTQN